MRRGYETCMNSKVTDCLSKPLKEGDSWYLLSVSWFRKFLKFNDDGICEPGPIDQSDIVLFKDAKYCNGKDGFSTNNGFMSASEMMNADDSIAADSSFVLKDNLEEELDFVLIPSELWNEMKLKFSNGPDFAEIERLVIRCEDDLFVEVYLIQIVVENDKGKKIYMEKSKVTNIGSIREEAGKKFGYWRSKMFLKDGLELESVGDHTKLYELSMRELHFSIEDCGDNWNEEVMPNLSKVYRSDSFDKAVSTYKPAPGGIVGLNNLGNTCFMNSALQCLSNTADLTKYFLSDDYKKEVNRSNKLGMGGLVAEAFAQLIREIWSTRNSNSSVTPRDFKYTISRFAPQFSGFRQHDSQELLAFLLDGLHEDLNRIVDKPYVEIKDADGRPDQIVAEEMWLQHKMRNDSIIVDLFQGQFKSTLVCPECAHISVTFDPFMFLSLPLPSEMKTDITVTVVDMKGNYRKEIYKVDRNGTIFDLKKEIEKKWSILKENWMICDVYNHRIYRELEDDKEVEEINSFDVIFAYECPEDVDFFWLLLSKDEESFGFPILITMHKDKVASENDLLRLMHQKILLFSSKEFSFDIFEHKFKCEKQGDDVVCKMPLDLYEQFFGVQSFSERVEKASETLAGVDKEITLYDCFNMFLKEERLGSSDPWYCPKCKKHQQATKKFDLWKLPDVLVIHMKRFCYTKYSRVKLSTPIKFPIKYMLLLIHRCLDLREHVIGPSKYDESSMLYDLYAVSNHFGGLGGGHYTAYAKNFSDRKWYDFNDSHVHPVPSIDSNSHSSDSNAYMLFYRRRKSDQ